MFAIGALAWLLAGAPALNPGGQAGAASLPAAERAALVALFMSTNGPGWKSSDGWLQENGSLGPPGTECRWEGISCTRDGTHVQSIYLAGNNLSGVLPDSLRALSRLETLDLSDNRLTGRIRDGLFALPELRRLVLTGNMLAGPLPAFRRGCRLEDLDLSNNKLRGPIPASLSQCAALETLSLGRNGFSGALPGSIRRLSRLQLVALSHNQLTGDILAALQPLSELAHVDIGDNAFSGAVGQLASLEALQSFRAPNNELSGELPEGIGRLRELRLLNVASNQLTGSIPPAIASLEQLVTLDLSGNAIAGPLPGFDRMESLRELRLNANRIDDDMGRLRLPGSLSVLDLSSNGFFGRLPEPLFERDTLTTLAVHHNRIDGSLPESLWSASSLQEFDASDNAISGQLPDAVPGLENLRLLRLARNRLSGSVPAALLSLPRLVIVDVSGNGLMGELPDSAGRALQTLDFSDNQISGTIPAWVGGLPGLRAFGIARNRLVDGLDVLASSTSLRAANVAGNAWRTAIPSKLAAMRQTLAPWFPLLTADAIDPSLGVQPPPPPPPPPAPPRTLSPGETPAGQQNTITGVVRDGQGGVLPGADVTAASPASTFDAKTDADGRFSFTVPPGVYQVTASVAGFSTVMQSVTIGAAESVSTELIVPVAELLDTVTVSAEVTAARQGPWWNTWVTRRGADEGLPEAAVQPNRTYTFYLELSALERQLSGTGVRSDAVASTFVQQVKDLTIGEGPDDPALEPSLMFRFMVVGRSAQLLDGTSHVEVWNGDGWEPARNGGASAVAKARFAVFREPDGSQGAAVPLEFLRSRAAALRFGLQTGSAGCAVVAVSIWDERGIVPLDSMVHFLDVGDRGRCSSGIPQAQANTTLLGAAGADASDVSLHSFEFNVGGRLMSASFMALREPVAPCRDYQWSSDATVSELVLTNQAFKDALRDARLDSDEKSDGYANVARLLQQAVFPRQSRVSCGPGEAWRALQLLAANRRPSFFARLADQYGQLQVVPLGLLAMAKEKQQPILQHDVTVVLPLRRQTLDQTSCVSAWTFVLPSTLSGLGELEIPEWAQTDSRVLRSRDKFETDFLEIADSTDPLGLLLLAHHNQGVLTFANSNDSLTFSAFDRTYGDGSIAVLSACEAGSLVDTGKLVTRLNDNGVDAMLVSAFVIDPEFGKRLAVNVATAVKNIAGDTDLVSLLETALDSTVREHATITNKNRARGMALELVLTGNPRLRVCPLPAP